MSSFCVHLALSPSIHFLHVPPTCIGKFSWNLKLDVGFLNAFFLRNVLYKNSLFKMFKTGVLCTVCGAQVYLTYCFFRQYPSNMKNTCLPVFDHIVRCVIPVSLASWWCNCVIISAGKVHITETTKMDLDKHSSFITTKRGTVSICVSYSHTSREKGRDLTQSYDKNPYTNRKL